MNSRRSTDSSTSEDLGFREFHATIAGWKACWNAGSMRVVFTVPRDGASLPIRLNLSSLDSFYRDLTELPLEKRRCFQRIIENWPLSTSELPDSSWLTPFERMAFFLAAGDRGHLVPREAEGDRLMVWLRRQGSGLVWLSRFNEDLSYAMRYRLLRVSVERFAQQRVTQREEAPLVDLSDPDMRQQYWFTVRMNHALAEKWCEAEGLSSTESAKALRQSKLTYLQVLYEEPYRRELDRFLFVHGKGRYWRSGSECEVARLLNLFGDGQQPTSLTRLREGSAAQRFDTTLDSAFFSWFMQRYDQTSGLKLLVRGMSTSERWWAVVTIVMAALSLFAFVGRGLYTFLLPLIHPVMAWLPPEEKISDLYLWSAQVALQVLALLTAAWLAPISFNFVLPRAFFSSLLTWFTLILTSVPALWAVEFRRSEPASNLRRSVYEFMAIGYPHLAPWLAVPILMMCGVFVMRQIGVWTSSRRTILLRGILATFMLFVGSFFWGAIFSFPIYSILRPEDAKPVSSCLLTIAIVGAASAAFLGILVELVWEDKSIAEPLEDPL